MTVFASFQSESHTQNIKKKIFSDVDLNKTVAYFLYFCVYKRVLKVIYKEECSVIHSLGVLSRML